MILNNGQASKIQDYPLLDIKVFLVGLMLSSKWTYIPNEINYRVVTLIIL